MSRPPEIAASVAILLAAAARMTLAQQPAAPAAGTLAVATSAARLDDSFARATAFAQSRAQAPVANWPSFRGPNAAGIADGQSIPGEWNIATGQNIRWRVEIPGLGHGSPIVWGDRLFVTTAVSGAGDHTFKPGLYGDGTASEDTSIHKFMVIALDRRTGKTIWERVAFEGRPKQKRHIKSTHASSTPATDGTTVVALFGSMGLHAFDVSGKPLWSVDLGRIDAGAYDIPSFEWGTASSPIIYRDLVIVQCDQQKGSFIAAFNVRTGKEVWRTVRDELPSWGTPTVYVSAKPGRQPELITNASKAIRGYDPMTGKELWKLGGSSLITAPTPIFTDDYILIASGRRPERPIFVLRPGARGDITLSGEQTSNASVVWSSKGRGPYMPTPLIYGDLAYVLGNDGIFYAYELASGTEVYRDRMNHSGSGFSASPVASDGRLFLAAEDGDVFIVKAGRKFEVIGRHQMDEPLMATPAISSGTMYVRGQRHLTAIGAK